MIIPNVIQKTPNGERAFDIFSRLLEDRIIVLSSPIDDDVAALVSAQLLYLASRDSNRDISMYINSPGGSISAGLAIIDTMNYIKPDIQTICNGQAASMGAVILSCGTKGKRFILPNADVMIHQASGRSEGTTSSMETDYKRIISLQDRLYHMLAKVTGQSFEKIQADCKNDHWLTAQEALDYGLVDQIIEKSL